MRFTFALLFLGLSLLATPSQALEFRSIGANPVVMYDAPSNRGGKLYVAAKGMPVEFIFASGAWSRVRDLNGDLSWVESIGLNPRSHLVVRVTNAKIRSSADDSANLVFSADKFVLLEANDPPSSGWIKVRHRDGQSGYVRVNEVWGI
jgi:SH3-like domain-containing protein